MKPHFLRDYWPLCNILSARRTMNGIWRIVICQIKCFSTREPPLERWATLRSFMDIDWECWREQNRFILSFPQLGEGNWHDLWRTWCSTVTWSAMYKRAYSGNEITRLHGSNKQALHGKCSQILEKTGRKLIRKTNPRFATSFDVIYRPL
jgi:hypothetical protein